MFEARMQAAKRLSRYKQKNQTPSVPERLLETIQSRLEQGDSPASLLSVEQLTSAAGISRGTFYDHYRDVSDLIFHLMEMVTQEIIQGAGAWLAYTTRPQQQDFENGFRGMSAVFRKHRAIIATFNVLALTDQAAAQKYDAMVESVCERFRYSIAAARSEGLIIAGADAPVADAVSWIIVMFFSRFALTQSDADFEITERSLLHICRSALFFQK